MNAYNKQSAQDHTPLKQDPIGGKRVLPDITGPKQPVEPNTEPRFESQETKPDIDLDDTDAKIIDLYNDFNEDIKLASDKELEELKRLAQADALRAYSVFRRFLTRMQTKLKSLAMLPGKIKYKQGTYIFGVLLLGAVGLAGFKYLSHSEPDTSVLGLDNTQITFTPLIPAERQDSITNRSYDQGVDVLSYQDNIGGQSVTVAQQAVPEEIASRPDGAERVAAGLSADGAFTSIETLKGNVFISTNTNGGQAAVFIYNQVLVFINSLKPLDQSALTEYIEAI